MEQLLSASWIGPRRVSGSTKRLRSAAMLMYASHSQPSKKLPAAASSKSPFRPTTPRSVSSSVSAREPPASAPTGRMIASTFWPNGLSTWFAGTERNGGGTGKAGLEMYPPRRRDARSSPKNVRCFVRSYSPLPNALARSASGLRDAKRRYWNEQSGPAAPGVTAEPGTRLHAGSTTVFVPTTKLPGKPSELT